MKSEALRKLFAFGLVGGGASLLHIAVAVAMDWFFILSIFVVNLVGFLTAFLWSYLGHYHWTFRSSKSHRQAVPRFALTALAGYVVNNGVLLACTLTTGRVSVWFVVLAVGISAGVVYLALSVWALGERSP